MTASPAASGAPRRPSTRPTTTPSGAFRSTTTAACSRSSCLEGFQSGLSWLTILRKRENFRQAFAGFDFVRVARFGEKDVERLLQDAGIVRHRGKIEAAINNAQRAVELVDEEGSLAAYVWRFEPDPASRPKRLTWDVLLELSQTAGVEGAREGPEAPRLALRRPDDRLRVHAGDGARERPPGRLRRARARRARAGRVRPAHLVPSQSNLPSLSSVDEVGPTRILTAGARALP